MTFLIAGIDPGLDGAIAILDPGQSKPDPFDLGTNLNNPILVALYDMPTFEIKTNTKKRRQVDVYQVANMVRSHPGLRLAVIEEVHAMPKQGVTSSFSFGTNYGILLGIVAANAVPMRLVTPRTWKSTFGLSADKDESRRAASRLMPAEAKHWPLKSNDGRAEAVLLALYGAKAVR